MHPTSFPCKRGFTIFFEPLLSYVKDGKRAEAPGIQAFPDKGIPVPEGKNRIMTVMPEYDLETSFDGKEIILEAKLGDVCEHIDRHLAIHSHESKAAWASDG